LHEIWEWDELLLPYRQAVRELCVKFEAYTPGFVNRGGHTPIETVNGRVKRVSSILEKAVKKNIDYSNFDELAHKVGDVAGVRLTCRFEEDIKKAVAIIRERDGLDMHIADERDYINNIKKSGYRSYHMRIRYTVSMPGGPKEITAEIQIRTMAMNVWASTEHSLHYKYNGVLPENLQKRLFKSAEAAFLLDREMSIIRDELIEARTLIKHKQDLGDEILKNIKTLYHRYPTAAVAQLGREFITLNETRNLDELHEFNRRLRTLAQVYGEVAP
jgi:putative GTP pyrophosphokinase